MWQKCNPNIGLTISYEAYELDVERAEKAPASRNDILAKRFGIPMEGYTYYFTTEETKPHNPRDFWGMSCSLGIDLSQGDDFVHLHSYFPLPYGQYGIKNKMLYYISNFNTTEWLLAYKYDEFLDEGSLQVLDGFCVRYDGCL